MPMANSSHLCPQRPLDNGQYLDIRGASEADVPPVTQNSPHPQTQSHGKLKSRAPVQFDQPNRWVFKQKKKRIWLYRRRTIYTDRVLIWMFDFDPQLTLGAILNKHAHICTTYKVYITHGCYSDPFPCSDNCPPLEGVSSLSSSRYISVCIFSSRPQMEKQDICLCIKDDSFNK